MKNHCWDEKWRKEIFYAYTFSHSIGQQIRIIQEPIRHSRLLKTKRTDTSCYKNVTFLLKFSVQTASNRLNRTCSGFSPMIRVIYWVYFLNKAKSARCELYAMFLIMKLLQTFAKQFPADFMHCIWFLRQPWHLNRTSVPENKRKAFVPFALCLTKLLEWQFYFSRSFWGWQFCQSWFPALSQFRWHSMSFCKHNGAVWNDQQIPKREW